MWPLIWASSPTVREGVSSSQALPHGRATAPLACRLFFSFRFLDTEFLQAILQSAKGQAQQLRGLRDVVIRLFHGLHDQVALDVFETDTFRWQLEHPLRRGARSLSYLKRQVFDRDQITFAKQNRPFDPRLQFPHLSWPTIVV